MSDNETRETWKARLWAANDEVIYSMTLNQPADSIRETFEEILYGDRHTGGVLGDVIGLWVQRVDWDAVAEAQADEDTGPTCDICDEPADDGYGDRPTEDWNPETGCHLSCER